MNSYQDRFESTERRSKKADTYSIWVVPYADFMTVLMVLFLMMFAFAYSSKNERRYAEVLVSIQKEMGGKVAQEVLDEMKERQATEQAVLKFDEIVEKQNLNKYVTIATDTEQIKVTLKNPVLFPVGSSELRNESQVVLHEVAQVLKDMENDIIIEGHTDSVPIKGQGRYASNWELSQSRALEVIRFFTGKEGLPPARFAAAGYGEFRPVRPNDTEENRSYNRRIEINILRNKTKA